MGIVKKAVSFLTSPLSLISKKLGKIVQGVFLIGAGIITGNPGLIMMGIGRAASALQKSPKVSSSTADRLTANLDAAAPRKIIFGRTAMATDVRYQAYTGSNQEYYEQICCVASHKVEAVEEIWFDTELAWSVAGGVTSKFAGYLTVAVKLEGTAANTVAIDANWGSAQRLTGCAYLHLKFKLTGNDKKTQSPFQAIPSRVTIRGKGAFVPDPRLSTAAGGSGSQNMGDQSTWAYTTAADSGRNPICQTLYYLLGWKINTKLAVGLGSPSARLDFASFITAANICDESVAKAGGGTEPRYRSDGIFSEDDDPDTVLTSLLQAANAELTDAGGKIGIRIDFNDLASPVVALTDDDILDGDDWNPTAGKEDHNIVRGRYTDPSDGALYQLVDYPQVTLAGADYGSPDGVQRIDSFDLPCVQSPSQAQRLAKLRLQRKQYPGIFSARFKMKGWGASYGKIVTLTHASLGFSVKKFRVSGQTIHWNGSVDLVLREVDPAQFTWSAEEAAVVAAAAPTAYNPLNNPLVAFLGNIADDNVLTGQEKATRLLPDLAELAARYAYLVARATLLGVSTTAVAAAKTNFLAYLAGLSPTHDDVTQDTTLSTSLITGIFPAGWALNNGTFAASGIYQQVSDGSAVAYAGPNVVVTVNATGTVTFAIVVKKDAIAKTTRSVGFALFNSAVSVLYGRILIDTSTGSVFYTDGTPSASGCFALNDTEWLAWLTIPSAAYTQVAALIYPAPGADVTVTGFQVSTTGSVYVRDPVVVVGALDKAGRDVFNYRLKTYSAELDALAKAISEVDGVTSLQIDGPPVVNVPASSVGNASASFPLTRQYVARAGTGAVTPTWNVTVLTGTATLAISAGGVLEMSGPTTPSVSATARIDASYGGANQSMTVQINRVDGSATSGGGSGTITEVAVDATINSTTFTTIATIAQTVASAAPVLTAPDLEIYAATVGGSGSWNIEFKGVRENGVTDVDIGSVANSSPDPTVSAGPISDPGYASLSVTDSGRSVGVSYTYYLQAKLTSGTRGNHITGTFRVTS